MNNKILLVFIVLGFIAGFFIATYLYLPHIGIQDDLYVVDTSSLQDKSLDTVDCNAIRKNMLLKELDVLDTSTDKVSSYLNQDTPADQSTELHVLSVYNGFPVVKIKVSKKPVSLFLSSVEATIWTIQLEEETQLNKIHIVDQVREIRIKRKAPKDHISKLNKVFLRKKSLLQNIEIEKFKLQKRSKCNTFGYKWHPDHKGKFRSFIGTTRELPGTEPSIRIVCASMWSIPKNGNSGFSDGEILGLVGCTISPIGFSFQPLGKSFFSSSTAFMQLIHNLIVLLMVLSLSQTTPSPLTIHPPG